ncbi:MAG: hypothetical protein A2119_01200 [Candidatus Colwellbacteria bacterium GWA2_46_10]|uniref:4Fe-4S Wbl-type domain-containing protein n=1 Tax=Candidatus Colwellbacteria bacterium GWA2_46_10 TaxID=1797684 RepID=A0A1G1YXF7_9BACT|nr:MAG: hypothetical protein A2119_01200 [Candidatus Colwellbacteria bacterium GWA2_46_10]
MGYKVLVSKGDRTLSGQGSEIRTQTLPFDIGDVPCRWSFSFFPHDPENQDAREQREQMAKSLCTRCDAKGECLEFALATREKYGIWGGTTEKERRRILRRRTKD